MQKKRSVRKCFQATEKRKSERFQFIHQMYESCDFLSLRLIDCTGVLANFRVFTT